MLKKEKKKRSAYAVAAHFRNSSGPEKQGKTKKSYKRKKVKDYYEMSWQ